MPIPTGSPLGELSERILPGASEDALKEVIRNAVGIKVLSKDEFDSLTVKDPNTTYILKGTNVVEVPKNALVSVPSRGVIETIGDSTVAGISTNGGSTQLINSWPTQFSNMLNSIGVKSTAQNRFGCASGSWSTLLTLDNRITSTGAWSQTGSLVAGGNAFGSSAAGSATFSLGVCSRIILHWINNTAGREFTYSIDGATPITVTTTGVYEPRQESIAVPLGLHSVTIAWKTTSCNFRAVEMFDDITGNPVRIYNLGISGATSAQLIDNSDTVVGRRVQYGQLQPDLAIIEGGIINDWRQSVPVATSKANLTTLVQTLKAAKGGTCKVLLLTPVFDNSTTGNTANQEQYVTAMKEVALEQNVSLYDVRPVFQSWAFANSQGWMSDDVHLTALGYNKIASLLMSVVFVSP